MLFRPRALYADHLRKQKRPVAERWQTDQGQEVTLRRAAWMIVGKSQTSGHADDSAFDRTSGTFQMRSRRYKATTSANALFVGRQLQIEDE
jgi:hypothetical protein